MAAKNFFRYCATMLIYANQRDNDGVDLKFFLCQKKRIR